MYFGAGGGNNLFLFLERVVYLWVSVVFTEVTRRSALTWLWTVVGRRLLVNPNGYWLLVIISRALLSLSLHVRCLPMSVDWMYVYVLMYMYASTDGYRESFDLVPFTLFTFVYPRAKVQGTTGTLDENTSNLVTNKLVKIYNNYKNKYIIYPKISKDRIMNSKNVK